MNTKTVIRSVACVASLAAANFVYQAFGDQLWIVAGERSFFQATAVIVFVLLFSPRAPA